MSVETSYADDRWEAFAACRGMDPEIFFPERGDSKAEKSQVSIARGVCATCPVIDDCLREHLWEREGVFAGMTARERKAFRRDHPEMRHRKCSECGETFATKTRADMTCSTACSRVRTARAEMRARRL